MQTEQILKTNNIDVVFFKSTAQFDHTRPLFVLFHWQCQAAAQHPASHRRMLATMSEKTHTQMADEVETAM